MIGWGVVYAAVGDEHLARALESAKSLKRHNADLPTRVFVRQATPEAHAVFDDVVLTDEPDPHVVKAIAVAEMPFERTLFLDADTRVCGRLDEAFAVLNRFDIAGVQDRYIASWRIKSVPMAFPEINTGVLFVRRGDASHATLSKWVELVRINPERFNGKQGDQGAFREALYFGDARIATLPPIWNVRLGALNYLAHKAVILHSRELDLEAVENVINRNGRMRIYDARTGEMATW